MDLSLKENAIKSSKRLSNAIWHLAGDLRWIGIKPDQSSLQYRLVVGAGPKTYLSIISSTFEGYNVTIVANAYYKVFPVAKGNV